MSTLTINSMLNAVTASSQVDVGCLDHNAASSVSGASTKNKHTRSARMCLFLCYQSITY